MSSTLPIPSHPWALDGEYDFSGLSATMEYWPSVRDEILAERIQQMVKDDERLQNLSQEEMDQYITTLEEHCDTKSFGSYVGHQVADVARQYEQWACTQNQNLLERDSLGSLRKQITKAISSGLEKVTHKKHIVMNYHNYETAIVETYGVRLLNTRRAAGETVRKTRKKRSDAGTTRKRKAPAGGKENVQLRKKARSSHRRGLPKSAEIISTSDEEDSEDA
ncbi:hypothetical protein BKA83DRAFT_4628937 [Pisolithus microcarpus]|nr:hypothetical protein BKA83DRAFT_4628937 [Pisolithus microcarpus]